MRGLAGGLGCGVAVGVLLLAGCTSGGSTPHEETPGKKDSASARASPSPAMVVDVDPARLPRTQGQAADLVRDVLPGPSAFGHDAVRRTPYESDPRHLPVLGDDCVWRQEALPEDVLTSLTRSYEIPAGGGRDPLRLSAVVTVHRTAEQADWEDAEVLEEMMRCPSQRLRSDESITSLNDVPAGLGESGNEYADDSLTELGTYQRTGSPGSHPYIWEQTRIDRFTLAVCAKGADGWSRDDLFDLLRDPHTGMRARLRAAIGRDTPGPGGSAEGDRR